MKVILTPSNLSEVYKRLFYDGMYSIEISTLSLMYLQFSPFFFYLDKIIVFYIFLCYMYVISKKKLRSNFLNEINFNFHFKVLNTLI